MSAVAADWTAGEPRLNYQHCNACSSVWYFHRTFCPRCGAVDIDDRQSSGEAFVHAITLVTRAPTEEMRAYAPYVILLADAAEGFRLMAHGEQGLAIGDRVRCSFKTLAGRLIPYFEKDRT